MFERFTEKARRVIFFARYEASQFGSPCIETEHLLLGLVREDKALMNRFVGSNASVQSIRRQVERSSTVHEKVSTSVDLPLANDCKRILAYAAEEAEGFTHRHIGTEHLLLGILRTEKCFAANLLIERGMSIDPVRSEIARQPHETAADIPIPSYRNHGVAGGIHAAAGGVHTQRPDPLLLVRRFRHLRTIRIWLSVVIVGLVLSGVTAFPLQSETALLVRIATSLNLPQHSPALNAWLVRVASALADTNTRYPFLAYGTDWLAFAHLVIAAAFIGPWIDPVRNKWFIIWGFVSCAAVPFLAFIAGPIRGIPFYWRCIDSSFGLFCCLALLALRRSLTRLEALAPYRA